jgi:hypothetical protein
MARLPGRVLFGLDTPWSVLTWPDGRRFGAAPEVDLDQVCLAADRFGAGGRYRFLHENGLAFARGAAAGSTRHAPRIGADPGLPLGDTEVER